jgi:hypothetical protein
MNKEDKMKRTIVLIAIAAITLLLLPIALFSAPKDYLGAEGSSFGLIISQEAKQEAMQARADRFLLYQGEIDALVLDSPQGAEGGSAGAAMVPLGVPDGITGADGQRGSEDHHQDNIFDPEIDAWDPSDSDAGSCGRLGCGDEGGLNSGERERRK